MGGPVGQFEVEAPNGKFSVEPPDQVQEPIKPFSIGRAGGSFLSTVAKTALRPDLVAGSNLQADPQADADLMQRIKQKGFWATAADTINQKDPNAPSVAESLWNQFSPISKSPDPSQKVGETAGNLLMMRQAWKMGKGQLKSAPNPAVAEALSKANAIPPEELTPAPYRLRGDQITDARTATPKRVLGPERQLGMGDAPVEPSMPPLKASTPEAAQAEILKRLGVAGPRATSKPLTQMPPVTLKPSPDLLFSTAKDGADAATQQLMRYSINELRGIAMQRGIKIKPGDTNSALVQKISDNLTDGEIDAFDQARIERMQPRYGLGPQKLGPQQAYTPSSAMEDILQKSIQQAKAKKAAAGR